MIVFVTYQSAQQITKVPRTRSLDCPRLPGLAWGRLIGCGSFGRVYKGQAGGYQSIEHAAEQGQGFQGLLRVPGGGVKAPTQCGAHTQEQAFQFFKGLKVSSNTQKGLAVKIPGSATKGAEAGPLALGSSQKPETSAYASVASLEPEAPSPLAPAGTAPLPTETRASCAAPQPLLTWPAPRRAGWLRRPSEAAAVPAAWAAHQQHVCAPA
ncbi:g5246 [Coccomyxa elongata]